MTDSLGRSIEYLRISLTDRCNLRCRYCMPDGAKLVAHGDILRYEELLRIAAAALALGITRFKVTGGEPLVRRGAVDFMSALKALPGVERVTLTTNGVLLPEVLPRLLALGIDGVNISLDTLNDDLYSSLTKAPQGTGRAVLEAVGLCAASSIATKVNAVLLPETLEEAPALAALAAGAHPVDVRFIEWMPIGQPAPLPWVSMEAALERLRAVFPDLAPTGERRGNGPAVYYGTRLLEGRIGFIPAMSHSFCRSCNRVRLTSTGLLKPCLCFDDGTDLRALLRSGVTQDGLTEALAAAIRSKPPAHRLEAGAAEGRTMNQIGG